MFQFDHFPKLYTKRLTLRALTRQDAPALFALFSDTEVTKYNDVTTFQEIGEAYGLLDFLDNRFRKEQGLRWAITRRGDDTLIGTCGYNTWMRHNNCGEIGYDIAREHWGRGFATEAVAGMVGFGFDSMALNRIEADVVVGNDASVRVLLKNGFVEEGILRQRGFWKGRYHDLHFCSLLKSEHNKRVTKTQ